MTTTISTDIGRLEAAFALLESKGIKARSNFLCCGGCATAQLDSEKDTEGFAYWHAQDDERAFGRLDVEYDCGTCVGSGYQDCDECEGTGEVTINPGWPDPQTEDTATCSACNGDGRVYCDTCGGDGTITEEGGDDGERQYDDLQDDLYIGYGHRDESKSLAVGIEVVKALVEQGFEVEWDGDTSRRIAVKKDS